MQTHAILRTSSASLCGLCLFPWAQCQSSEVPPITHKIEHILFMQDHTRLLFKRSHTSPACGHAYSMCYSGKPHSRLQVSTNKPNNKCYGTLSYSSVETCLHTLLACSLHSWLCSYGQHYKQEEHAQRSAAMSHLLHKQRGHDAGHDAQEHLRSTSGAGLTMRRRTHARHKPAVLSMMPSPGQLSHLFLLIKTA